MFSLKISENYFQSLWCMAGAKFPISFQLKSGEKNEKFSVGIRNRICI